MAAVRAAGDWSAGEACRLLVSKGSCPEKRRIVGIVIAGDAVVFVTLGPVRPAAIEDEEVPLLLLVPPLARLSSGRPDNCGASVDDDDTAPTGDRSEGDPRTL